MSEEEKKQKKGDLKKLKKQLAANVQMFPKNRQNIFNPFFILKYITIPCNV